MNEIITWAIIFGISTIGVSFVWDAIQKALSSDNSTTVTITKNQKERLEQFEKAGIDPNDYTLDDNKESSGENKSLSFVGSVKKHLENNAQLHDNKYLKYSLNFFLLYKLLYF